LQRPRIVVHHSFTLYAVVFVQLSVVVDALCVGRLPAFARAGGHAMAVLQGGVRFDQIAAKWHALAQRRLAHARELERFGLYLRETERVAALWAKLAAARFAAPPGRKFNASGHLRRA
jgi:hypothetical protein